MQNSRYLDGYLLKLMLRVHNWLNVNSQQAVTSDWSQSITNCVNGSTAIPAMYWPQELEQLIGPNMEATNRLKWRMTSSHKVHTGASLHLPQEQLHNATHTHRYTTLSFESCSIERQRGLCCNSNIRAEEERATCRNPAVRASYVKALWNYILLPHTCMCKSLK